MKRIVIYPCIIIFAVTLVSLVWLQQVIPNIILSKFYNEDVIFSNFKSLWAQFYIAGCFLASVYLSWKYASMMDKKVVSNVKAFGFKINRMFLLILSVLFLVIPFNQLVVFSNTGVHDFNIFLKNNKGDIVYKDITKVYVTVFFDQFTTKGQNMCQVRSYFTFISGDNKIESWIRMPYIYDIGSILKQNNAYMEVVYTNTCNDGGQFKQEKIDLENALGVRFE